MSDNISIATYFYLFSGELLKDQGQKNWESPQGIMVDGNKMFEEAFLTQIYWLAKNKLINLNERKDHIFLARLKGVQPQSPFTKFLLDNLSEEEILFKDWIKILARKSGNLNPARDIFKKVRKEAQAFQKENKSRFLIFTFTTKNWDLDRIEKAKNKNFSIIKKLWKEAKEQDWWQKALRELRDGLTFARFDLEQRQRL